jgi:hypothetical protein
MFGVVQIEAFACSHDGKAILDKSLIKMLLYFLQNLFQRE